jgi:type I restriction enzyme S subunit
VSAKQRSADIPPRKKERGLSSPRHDGFENPRSGQRDRDRGNDQAAEADSEETVAMRKWRQSTVREVAAGFLSGGTPTTSHPDYWQGDIPWITSKWLGAKLELTTGEKFVSEEAVRKSATKIVPKNSIIFATRVGVGKVGINRIDLAINQDLAGVLIDNERHDIEFLAYQLGTDSIQQYVAMNKRGATIKGITRDCLEQIRLNLPPLPEQKKIAHILSTVQRAIEAQERIIQTTTELKKALMHKLFTEGLRGEPQKQTEIGPVPESWEVVAFDKFVTLQRGYDLRKQDFREGPVPVIGATQVIGYHDTANVKAPGVTVVRSGSSAGKPMFIAEDFWAHNVLLYVKDFQGNVPKFVYYKILALDLTQYRQGVAVPTLNRNNFSAVELAVPSPEKQKEISDALDAVGNRTEVAERKKTQLQDLFRTLLHELMTAKTRIA